MGFGQHLQVTHSSPCTNSPMIHPPHQHLFIQQIPSFDLLLSTLNVSWSGDFSAVTFYKYLLFFFLFLGNIKQNYSVFLTSSCVQVPAAVSGVLRGSGQSSGLSELSRGRGSRDCHRHRDHHRQGSVPGRGPAPAAMPHTSLVKNSRGKS